VNPTYIIQPITTSTFQDAIVEEEQSIVIWAMLTAHFSLIVHIKGSHFSNSADALHAPTAKIGLFLFLRLAAELPILECYPLPLCYFSLPYGGMVRNVDSGRTLIGAVDTSM
jgi:hypothetical protein